MLPRTGPVPSPPSAAAPIKRDIGIMTAAIAITPQAAARSKRTCGTNTLARPTRTVGTNSAARLYTATELQVAIDHTAAQAHARYQLEVDQLQRQRAKAVSTVGTQTPDRPRPHSVGTQTPRRADVLTDVAANENRIAGQAPALMSRSMEAPVSLRSMMTMGRSATMLEATATMEATRANVLKTRSSSVKSVAVEGIERVTVGTQVNVHKLLAFLIDSSTIEAYIGQIR